MILLYKAVCIYGSETKRDLQSSALQDDMTPSLLCLSTNMSALKTELTELRAAQQATAASVSTLQSQQYQAATTNRQIEQKQSSLEECIILLQRQQANQEERLSLTQNQQQKQREDHISIHATLTETNAALRHIVTILEASHKHTRTGISLSISPSQKIDRPCRRKNPDQKPAWHY